MSKTKKNRRNTSLSLSSSSDSNADEPENTTRMQKIPNNRSTLSLSSKQHSVPKEDSDNVEKKPTQQNKTIKTNKTRRKTSTFQDTSQALNIEKRIDSTESILRDSARDSGQHMNNNQSDNNDTNHTNDNESVRHDNNDNDNIIQRPSSIHNDEEAHTPPETPLRSRSRTQSRSRRRHNLHLPPTQRQRKRSASISHSSENNNNNHNKRHAHSMSLTYEELSKVPTSVKHTNSRRNSNAELNPLSLSKSKSNANRLSQKFTGTQKTSYDSSLHKMKIDSPITKNQNPFIPNTQSSVINTHAQAQVHTQKHTLGISKSGLTKKIIKHLQRNRYREAIILFEKFLRTPSFQTHDLETYFRHMSPKLARKLVRAIVYQQIDDKHTPNTLLYALQLLTVLDIPIHPDMLVKRGGIFGGQTESIPYVITKAPMSTALKIKWLNTLMTDPNVGYYFDLNRRVGKGGNLLVNSFNQLNFIKDVNWFKYLIEKYHVAVNSISKGNTLLDWIDILIKKYNLQQYPIPNYVSELREYLILHGAKTRDQLRHG